MDHSRNTLLHDAYDNEMRTTCEDDGANRVGERSFGFASGRGFCGTTTFAGGGTTLGGGGTTIGTFAVSFCVAGLVIP